MDVEESREESAHIKYDAAVCTTHEFHHGLLSNWVYILSKYNLISIISYNCEISVWNKSSVNDI